MKQNQKYFGFKLEEREGKIMNFGRSKSWREGTLRVTLTGRRKVATTNEDLQPQVLLGVQGAGPE